MDPIWFSSGLAIGIGCGINSGKQKGKKELKEKLKDLIKSEEIYLKNESGEIVRYDELVEFLESK